MRHFRLRNASNYGTIGTVGESTTVGNTAHWGLLPGTYGLAWEMSSGDQTYNVPFLTGAWDQEAQSTIVVSGATSCSHPTGIDVVALFNQSTDPKDPDGASTTSSHSSLGVPRAGDHWPSPPLPTTDVVIK
jgi:hypothetical protein